MIAFNLILIESNVSSCPAHSRNRSNILSISQSICRSDFLFLNNVALQSRSLKTRLGFLSPIYDIAVN